jgi:hypothetical protein
MLCENRWVCAVKAELAEYSILVINLYMPCDTDHDVSNVTVFNEVLNDVSTILSTLNMDHAIVGGDLMLRCRLHV